MKQTTSDGENYFIYGKHISKDYWLHTMKFIPDIELIKEVKRRRIVVDEDD